MSTTLLDRFKKDDPSALEELGHEVLPFVQAALLAHMLAPKDATSVLWAFREVVGEAVLDAVDDAVLATEVMRRMRERARLITAAATDPMQVSAVMLLQRLQPMPAHEREVVLARFVERLPPAQVLARYHLDPNRLRELLVRGAALLAPQAPAGGWEAQPLADPDAVPLPEVMQLENVLGALAIDATALEQRPLERAPAPLAAPAVLQRAPVVDAPPETYPSRVETQGVVDLPEQLKAYVVPKDDATAPVQVPSTIPPPEAKSVLDERTRISRAPSPPVPLSMLARPLEATPEMVSPLARRAPPSVADEPTDLRGTPLPREPEPEPPPRRAPALLWWGAAALSTLVAVATTWAALATIERDTRRGWRLVPVVVANRDLPEGATLEADVVATRAVPDQFATSSVVTPELLPAALGQRLIAPLQAGDHLLWEQLEGSRSSKRFSTRIQRRARAYAIPVSEVGGVGNQLKPDDHADLLMVVPRQAVGQDKKAEVVREGRTLVQDVPVLAVGALTTETIGRLQRTYSNVSLLLIPEEAEVLALALEIGPITASLRGEDDHDTLDLVPGSTTIDTLLAGERSRLAQKKRAETIQLIRGNAPENR